MPEIVELRQDRSLVINNFDGYKLSLEPLPLIRQELAYGIPLKAETNEDQYSLLHAELFAMQNLLLSDPWFRLSAYYVNRTGEIVRCAYDDNTGRPQPQTVTFRLPVDANERIKGDYNYSLRFISEKYCVLCDGVRNLYLLDTADREKGLEWKLVDQTAITALEEDQRNFSIFDARLDIVQEKKIISLALAHIERVDLEDGSSFYHNMQIFWKHWMCNDNKWILEDVDILEGRGSLYYCAFEPRAASLIVCSNKDYAFRSKKLQKESEELNLQQQPNEPKPQLHEEPESDYSWTQTDDDIAIRIANKSSTTLKDYSILSTSETLKVELQGELLLDIKLFEKVDKELTTWAIENDTLEIKLIKEPANLFWLSAEKDGAGPPETKDNNSSSIPNENLPIANLEAPIEECDYPMGTYDDDVKIVRFNAESKEATHSVLLGTQPPLFSTNLRPGFPNAIATRFDVDASLWLMQYNPSKPNIWNLRHEGNLHAFGYVQASKQQKKFVDCSPDFSYGIICESHKHVYLYKAKHDSENGLRNRHGPQVSLGKQSLINLEDSGEVLGIATATDVVIILTDKNVLYLQIN